LSCISNVKITNLECILTQHFLGSREQHCFVLIKKLKKM
jgi:hypothetical protein